MKAILLALVAGACLSGCALDEAFRARVESAEFTVAGTGDKAGNYGGSIGTTLHFRNPRRTTRDNK